MPLTRPRPKQHQAAIGLRRQSKWRQQQPQQNVYRIAEIIRRVAKRRVAELTLVEAPPSMRQIISAKIK